MSKQLCCNFKQSYSIEGNTTRQRDLTNLRHHGNINEDFSMNNKYKFPKLQFFENK